MLITFSGITTLTIADLDLKAYAPIAVTGLIPLVPLSYISGITIFVAVPTYPVAAEVPALTV